MPYADKRRSIKKEQSLFVLSLQYCQFGQDGWKSRTFSWRSVENELVVEYVENLGV